MDMNEINERLKDILATEGKKAIKDADVARELSISPNSYAQMKFRNKVPYKQIMNFLAKRGISINLFFYNQDGKALEPAEHKYKVLRFFKASASLGGGAINDDMPDYDEVVMDKKILRHFSNCSKPYPVDIINASGDSMHPYICDDDLCLIAVGMPYKDGDICAVNTPDGVVIKQVERQGDEIILISYNPLYPPARYYAFECEIVGVFAGLMRDLKPIKYDGYLD